MQAVIDMHAKGGDNRIPIPDTGRHMRQIAHTPVPAFQNANNWQGSIYLSTGAMIQTMVFIPTAARSNVCAKGNAQKAG